jgi:DNA-directed RNA polymerase subunit RPC12/RpoP
LGTKKNVASFVDRFVFNSEDEGHKTLEGHKYFARSFIWSTREEAHRDIDRYFKSVGEETPDNYLFPADFAWSASGCLISGYPQKFPECIDLASACQEDQVSVEIETEECGMCFEEDISCDEHGNVTDESHSMPTYICRKCKAAVSISTSDDVDSYECPECGSTDWQEKSE